MQKRAINAALTRPETVAGAEKLPIGLVVTGAVLFGLMAWWFLSVVALAVSLLLLFGGVPTVRRIAKADPEMFKVYRANLWLRPYYPARTGAHVREGKPKSSASTFLTIGMILAGLAWLFGSVLALAGAVLCIAILAPIAAVSAKQPAAQGED